MNVALTPAKVPVRMSVQEFLDWADEDGKWPAIPAMITEGDLILDSVNFRVPLAALYRKTRLVAARGP